MEAEVVSLEQVKKLCDQFLEEMAMGNDGADVGEGVEVRFINPDGELCTTYVSDLFFYHDKMYYWTQRKNVENYMTIDDFDLYGPLVELLAFKDIRIIPVLYAGVYTGYRDDKGKKIFTGDVVKATTLMNTDNISNGGMSRAKHPNKNYKGYSFIAGVDSFGEGRDDYYYVLDNCPIQMRYTNKVVVIGNVFYDLDRDDMSVDIGSRCAMLAHPHHINMRNLRTKMAHAPYFKCKTWQDIALKVLKDEPRYDNLPIYMNDNYGKGNK